MSSTDLKREGAEYESRLFGGTYSAAWIPKMARTSPKRKAIELARLRYNEIRAALGLPAVTDWNTLPEQLVQHIGKN